MTWVPLTIRSQADGSDSTMHPVPLEGRNTIAFDAHDGSYRKEFRATGISLVRQRPGEQRDDTLMEGSDLKVALILTESRVAVACSKYDTGGGWRGDPISMAVLNGLSKTYAAIKTYRKSVVGHVRYPWLRAVGFIEKTGWLSEEAVRLHVGGPSGASGVNSFLLDLALPKKTSAKQVASEIAYLAARHRLVTNTYTDETRSALDALMEPPDLMGEKKRFVFHELPGALIAGPSTAYGEEPPGATDVAGDGGDESEPIVEMGDVIEALTPTQVSGKESTAPERAEPSRAALDGIDVTRPKPEPIPEPEAAPASNSFTLIDQTGERTAVSGEVAIGRNPSPPDEYPSAETLVVSDMSVSKTHAVIGCTGGRTWAFDFHSTNGVRVRSADGLDRLSPGWPQELEPGAIVELGHDTAFRVAPENDGAA